MPGWRGGKGMRGRDMNAALSDRYCVSCLTMGMSDEEKRDAEELITAEMIALKRLQISMRRTARQINDAASQLTEESHETITDRA